MNGTYLRLGVSFVAGVVVGVALFWETPLTVNPIATFVLGAGTVTVGLVAFTSPYLRGQRDERNELRKANARLSDLLQHQTRGTVGDDWLESGVEVFAAEQERRTRTRPDYGEPLAEIPTYDASQHPVRTLDDGTPVLEFDDIRNGGER